MLISEERIAGLVRQWARCDTRLAEQILAEDFVYISEIEIHGRGDFVSGIVRQAPWEELRILAILVGSSNAAAFFEGVDPVTNLEHREAWLLDHDGERVHKLVALRNILPIPAEQHQFVRKPSRDE